MSLEIFQTNQRNDYGIIEKFFKSKKNSDLSILKKDMSISIFKTKGLKFEIILSLISIKFTTNKNIHFTGA